MRNHSTGNTDDGLFDLLIIVGLEYHREWTENGTEVLENAKQRLRQLRSMGVDSIERFIKNVTVIQSNLELMDEEPFGYHE